jgi:hypothetical protein
VEGVARIATIAARISQRSMTFRNSAIEPGQPWVMMSGKAVGSGERTCRKWMFCPSMVVVNCG